MTSLDEDQTTASMVSTGSEHISASTSKERTMVVEAEALLWSSSARRDGQRLEWLLHHEYSGVTREGEAVTRQEAVDATRGSVARGERDFTDWQFHPVPWPLVLTSYRLLEDRGTSRHMSLWDVSTGLARLRFHQGTWTADPHDG